MALRVSRNAPSLQAIPSCTSSRLRIKLELSGTTPTTVSLDRSSPDLVLTIVTVSQYCDGLRGAMVVYDPADPHRSLYVPVSCFILE
jgi:hypothetical protein